MEEGSKFRTRFSYSERRGDHELVSGEWGEAERKRDQFSCLKRGDKSEGATSTCGREQLLGVKPAALSVPFRRGLRRSCASEDGRPVGARGLATVLSGRPGGCWRAAGEKRVCDWQECHYVRKGQISGEIRETADSLLTYRRRLACG